ncbi:UNVERIFIED_CONTAM: NmrA family NAD(P)-binding protein, partial [Bacteroidetes bacterium 56_B9]
MADLTAALSDIDVLVCALSPTDAETQIHLADACVAAGVERFIPADYGSMRSDDPVVLEILPNFRN